MGLASVVGGGATAGVGFTVSLLIATKAFHGQPLTDAKLGILSTIVAAPLVTWMCAALTSTAARRHPPSRRHRLRAGVRRPRGASGSRARSCAGSRGRPGDNRRVRRPRVPVLGMAEQALRPLLAEASGELRYVWRHLPLNDVHPHAQMA